MKSAKAAERPRWEELSSEALLQIRICDLGLRIEGTPVETRAEQLYRELESKGLRFRPRIYLGDEWFSPEGVPAISVPFYLAHPRLRALEREMMLEVEGESQDACMRLLRHEAGHCFDHAYRCSKKRKWRSVFGSPEQSYDPDAYLARPYSRSFVRNIDNYYAQSHPDEDFAETFAVWLDPASDWQNVYTDWKGALAKLKYVDELASDYASAEPLVKTGPQTSSAARLRSTLGRYYQRKKKVNAESFPDFYDRDLVRIFDGSQDQSKREYGAARFMRRNRKRIVDGVSRWSGSRKYITSRFVRKLIHRCDEIDLKIGKSEEQTILEVSAYLSSIVTHYRFTGQFWRSH